MAQVGVLQALVLGLVFLLGAILPAAGWRVQAARRPSSGLLSASSGGDLPRGAERPIQLDHFIYLPIIKTSCFPDPPGQSDNIEDALTVCSGQTISGQVDDDDWDDVYKIQAAANQQLTVSMNGSGGDADLYLYSPDATDINTDDYADSSTNIGNDEFIQWTVPEAGFWYIDVNSFTGNTDYNVTVSLLRP